MILLTDGCKPWYKKVRVWGEGMFMWGIRKDSVGFHEAGAQITPEELTRNQIKLAVKKPFALVFSVKSRVRLFLLVVVVVVVNDEELARHIDPTPRAKPGHLTQRLFPAVRWQ